jgi:hypothetical protein
MPRNKREPLIKKKSPKSVFRWNEGAGEYEMKCPCGKKLYAPNLQVAPKVWQKHGQSDECKLW